MKSPASWTTIIHHRNTLTRHPDVLEAYQDFKLQLAAKGKSLEDNIREKVIKGAHGPILTPNQFPYWTETGIEHWVLWSPHGPLSPAEIRDAITAQRPSWVRRVFWFENLPAVKTVPGIWHVQVFLRAHL